jgi:hypothetical protein
MVEHRPSDPFALAVEFFQAAANPVPKVTEAFHLLQLAKRDDG